MSILRRWRKTYGEVRFAPITLIQTVFAAGTIFILSARQSGTGRGRRPAASTHAQALEMVSEIISILRELGQSWSCATRIAELFQKLVDEEKRLEANYLRANAAKSVVAVAKDEMLSPPLLGKARELPELDVNAPLYYPVDSASGLPTVIQSHETEYGYAFGTNFEAGFASHGPASTQSDVNPEFAIEHSGGCEELMDTEVGFLFKRDVSGQDWFNFGGMVDGASFIDRPFMTFDMYSTLR